MTGQRARRAGRLAELAAIGAVLLSTLPAAAAYPDPPIDFSHRGAPRADHPSLFTPEAGERDRPLLVVYHEFEDDAAPEGPRDLPRRIFGVGAAPGERSVVGYFRAASGGMLEITPARETFGTPDDGIVQVVVGERAAYDPDSPTAPAFHRRILEATDEYVDFRSFDANGDGAVGRDELLVLFVVVGGGTDEIQQIAIDGAPTGGAFKLTFTNPSGGVAEPTGDIAFNATAAQVEAALEGLGAIAAGDVAARGGPLPATAVDVTFRGPFRARDLAQMTATHTLTGGTAPTVTIATLAQGDTACGATRGIASDARADGVSLAQLGPALGGHLTNVITHVHELAHFGLDLKDTYGYGTGRLDLGGPTCFAGEGFHLPNAWHRLHWGWGRTEVVIRDGYRDVVPASRGGTAFILYDPARGSDDYLIVEARERDGAYDADASDDGVVVWRVADNRYFTGSDSLPPVEFLRPDGRRVAPGCVSGCYGGTDTDAFDPGDSRTPQRAMRGRRWLDGTLAPVGLFAIHEPASPPAPLSWRVYFDVVGPGILVDGVETGPIFLLADAPSLVPVRVVNTGEGDDSFRFDAAGAPPGWTVGTDLRSLPSYRLDTIAEVPVEPAGSTFSATVTVGGERASDPSVRSEDDVDLVWLPPPRLPDLDTRETPRDLSFIEHRHLDARVFEPGSPVTESTATWSYRSGGFGLPTALDEDFFRLALPDLAGEAGALAGRGDCHTSTVPGPFGDENVIVTGTLTVRVAPSGAHDASDVVRLHDVDSLGDSLRRVAFCPHTDGSPRGVSFSFGERPGGVPRKIGSLYAHLLDYRLTVQRVPQMAAWLVAERDARGARSVLPMPCAGGAFPQCPGGPRAVFDQPHPFDPQRLISCQAGGCPDHFTFTAARRESLDLVFASPLGLDFTLLDVAGKVVAQAAPVGQPKDPLPPPPQIQRAENSDVVADPNHVLGPPESQTQGRFTKQLRVAVEPGFYVLRVSGPPATYTVDLYSGILDFDTDGVGDAEDLCPARADVGTDTDGDGAGDVCDSTNAVLVDVEPQREDGVVKLSQRFVRVAVLSRGAFDASTLDAARICFGAAGAPNQRDCTEAHGRVHLEDADGDGRDDAVLHFQPLQTGLSPSSTRACLTALTLDGLVAEGCDDVRVAQRGGPEPASGR